MDPPPKKSGNTRRQENNRGAKELLARAVARDLELIVEPLDIKVIGPDPARVFNFVSIEVDQAERDKLNNIKLTDVSGPDISYLTKAINAEIIKAVWNKELLPEKEISCCLVPIPFKFLESFSNSFLSSLRTQIANLEERLARVERERDEAIAEAELRTHERDEAIAQVASREDQLRRAAEVLGRQ